ncbi:Hypothetical predicted protein [Marmota monax]|uniref:Uncharacterized protein n=1 Tax=Marmota monax TaxID=9995 RepID=A0A5E4CCI3_MARMO|nr:hypothetical protein GHT09_008056 [Marmota monax]VTJ79060.1 Hypothetical predicted protein [Marmota monax]
MNDVRSAQGAGRARRAGRAGRRAAVNTERCAAPRAEPCGETPPSERAEPPSAARSPASGAAPPSAASRVATAGGTGRALSPRGAAVRED